jgi:ribosomal protein L12E/L44/L45/RPP1/RPP2
VAIQIQGNGGAIAEVDGTGFRAMRMNKRPMDYGALGSYAVSARTGVMAAGLAANAEIFQLRWTDATRLCAITSVHCSGGGGIVAFAAGVTVMEVLTARSWTVAGSGGTAIALTTNNQKLRSSMGTSLVNDMRVSSTAALTAGTKTLDAQPIGSIVSSVGVTAGTPLWLPAHLYELNENDGQPIILAANEGIVVRATVPATGTWTASIDVTWMEMAAY